MRILEKKLIKMVCEKDPVFFEQSFNEAIEELKDFDPEPSEISHNDANGFWVCIKYTKKEKAIESVSDEFHLQGIRYLCKNCPLHEVETDGRIKRVPCKYSEMGYCHLEHEACEYFYKLLKQNGVRVVGV